MTHATRRIRMNIHLPKEVEVIRTHATPRKARLSLLERLGSYVVECHKDMNEEQVREARLVGARTVILWGIAVILAIIYLATF